MVSNRLNTIARVYDNIDLKCKIICPFKISAKAGIQLIQLVLDSCFRRRDGFPEIIKREGKE